MALRTMTMQRGSTVHNIKHGSTQNTRSVPSRRASSGSLLKPPSTWLPELRRYALAVYFAGEALLLCFIAIQAGYQCVQSVDPGASFGTLHQWHLGLASVSMLLTAAVPALLHFRYLNGEGPYSRRRTTLALECVHAYLLFGFRYVPWSTLHKHDIDPCMVCLFHAFICAMMDHAVTLSVVGSVGIIPAVVLADMLNARHSQQPLYTLVRALYVGVVYYVGSFTFQIAINSQNFFRHMLTDPGSQQQRHAQGLASSAQHKLQHVQHLQQQQKDGSAQPSPAGFKSHVTFAANMFDAPLSNTWPASIGWLHKLLVKAERMIFDVMPPVQHTAMAALAVGGPIVAAAFYMSIYNALVYGNNHCNARVSPAWVLLSMAATFCLARLDYADFVGMLMEQYSARSKTLEAVELDLAGLRRDAARLQAELDLALHNYKPAMVIDSGTPADVMMRILGQVLDGEAPKMDDIMFIQNAILEALDIYTPVNIEGQLLAANFDDDVQAELSRQLGSDTKMAHRMSPAGEDSDEVYFHLNSSGLGEDQDSPEALRGAIAGLLDTANTLLDSALMQDAIGLASEEELRRQQHRVARHSDEQLRLSIEQQGQQGEEGQQEQDLLRPLSARISHELERRTANGRLSADSSPQQQQQQQQQPVLLSPGAVEGPARGQLHQASRGSMEAYRQLVAGQQAAGRRSAEQVIGRTQQSSASDSETAGWHVNGHRQDRHWRPSRPASDSGGHAPTHTSSFTGRLHQAALNCHHRPSISDVGSPGMRRDVSGYSSTANSTPPPSNHMQAMPPPALSNELGTVPAPLLDEVEQLLATAHDWTFDAFALETATKGHPLSVLTFYLFHHSRLLSHFQIKGVKLARYLRRIEDGYPQNPYHNRTHAADVLRTMHIIMQGGGLVPGYADPLTLMACYLAAVIHDFEHLGLTNDYLVATRDPLAIRYNDKAPMENHHLAAAFSHLMRPQYNFLAHLPKHEFDRLRKLMIELVLATDMKQHFSILSQFNTIHQLNADQGLKSGVSSPNARAMRTRTMKTIIRGASQVDVLAGRSKGGAGLGGPGAGSGRSNSGRTNSNDEAHLIRNSIKQASHETSGSGAEVLDLLVPLDDSEHILSLQMALKIADLGALCAQQEVHVRWVHCLQEEFFRQGDKEKANNMPVTPLFDRDKTGVVKSQVGFFDVVAIPLYRSFGAVFSRTAPLMAQLMKNYQRWQSLEPHALKPAAEEQQQQQQGQQQQNQQSDSKEVDSIA